MDKIHIPLEVNNDCKPMILNWIPPGRFKMGNKISIKDGTWDEPEGQFDVVITKGFWLGAYQVTQCQWQSVMETNPSHFKGDNLPVGNLSWWDAIRFCKQVDISQLSLPESYACSLPTETQWEYACRAGTNYKYQLGNSIEELSRVAWYSDNTNLFSPENVGQKEPNNWDLYDMLGNVLEWCFDSQLDYPVDTIQTDWVGGSDDDFRNLRGGCARSYSTSTEITCGGRFYGMGGMPWTGFRICIRNINDTN